MEEVRAGQRLLMALAAQSDEEEESVGTFSTTGLLSAVGGVLCLICIILMCTCKDGKKKYEEEDVELQQTSKKGAKKSAPPDTQEYAEPNPKPAAESTVINGGPTQPVSSGSGHSRQASSGSGHMRPTSLRELPQLPVSSHHVRNTSLSGLEMPSASSKVGAGDNDYTYPQLVHTRNTNGNSKGSASANGNKIVEKVKSNSDGYDHLGPKPTVKPTDYDSLADPESEGTETPVSEASGVTDGHYSQLRERTYAVVKDVKEKAKDLFDPYSTVKDKEDSGSDYYSQPKDEDPYNHIGDSDGAVSMSFIRRIKQSSDFDDPYATVQEGSDGNLKTVMEARGAVGGGARPKTMPGRMAASDSSSQSNSNNGTDEYAVVQKGRGGVKVVSGTRRKSDDRNNDAEGDGGDISPYNVGPPEPPRLYNDYEDGDDNYAGAAVPKHKREHKYSKVTARESLASMSARNALNPYEVVPDLPENTYATVEGGSGDGVVMRGGATGGSDTNRLSQSSDTYAEIGISGGGLSSSVISSTSSAGGNNNSSSSGAPIPPSLDSLHLMTKSQTSSEGDRLSDRHLASPEDSGLGFHTWGDKPIEDDSGESTEDGYSTLKKSEHSPHDAALPIIPGTSRVTDEESGEVTLVPNYQTVKDCISDNEAIEEIENDPNYESVDETRAKVAALKARVGATADSKFLSNGAGGTKNHVTVVKVLRIANPDNTSSDARGQIDDLLHSAASKDGQKRRRPMHDYEEVDLSPPSSPPVSPSSSLHQTTMTSSYHSTSASHSVSATTTTTTVNSHQAAETRYDLKKEQERVIESHMYEELHEVRAKKSEMSKSYKTNAQDKSNADDGKKKTDDKKKVEEKRKSGSDEKRKSGSEDKRKSGSEYKRKSGSEDKKKSGGEDKKRNAAEEKRKSDEKKKGGVVSNGTKL